MSASLGLLAQLSLRMDAVPAHQLIREHRAEVLHETPLFLAEFDSVESEVHLTLEGARAMCDDIAKAVSNGQCWDWSRNEDGVYVQFWTHEDDDRPLHLTGGTVTEIRVQRPESDQEKDTREGESTPRFFRPGRTYTEGQNGYRAPELVTIFRVEHIARHPERDILRAFGWAKTGAPDAKWHGYFQDEGEFADWTDITESGDAG